MNFPLPARKRPPGGDRPAKKPRADDFLDLPTHLPNCPAPEKTADAGDENGAQAAKEPIFIEGTNITLQTEEDIAAWIAERKKNWPSRQNVERKMQQQTEKKTEPKRNVCKFFARNNRCKFGDKCKNVHESPKAAAQTVINGVAVTIPRRYKETEKGSLYTKLVQRDLYSRENDVVLSFLQYLNTTKGLDIEEDYSKIAKVD